MKHDWRLVIHTDRVGDTTRRAQIATVLTSGMALRRLLPPSEEPAAIPEREAPPPSAPTPRRLPA